MRFSLQKTKWFQRAVFTWFRTHGRKLPWRGIHDPYAITVSEVMLQQTQVDRVIIHFERWLKRFPTWQHLARAQQKSVVRQWSGMGYNRRALNLHKLARAIVAEHQGKLPRTIEELQQLPGIGPYTARVLMAFVWHKPQATADVNIDRVLHRVFFGSELPKPYALPLQLFKLAERIYPYARRNHVDWNHALMDFGALVCTARDPRCVTCPLAAHCTARTTIHRNIQLFYKQKKVSREPGVGECGTFIPNRIFRGRLVEHLRVHASVSVQALGPIIKKDYTINDEEWLRALIAKLVHEGILCRKGASIQLR